MGKRSTVDGNIPDPVDAFERMTEVVGKAQQMMLDFWAGDGGPPRTDALDLASASAGLAELWGDWAQAWATADTEKLVKLTGDYWTDALRLWSGLLAGKADELPEAAAGRDRRFADRAWHEQPVFDLVAKSYLLASHYLTESLGAFDGMPEDAKARLRFQAKQFIDAMSPANFAALNPEVIAEARATGGESLLSGIANLLEDLRRGKLTMTDERAFEVGRNVAATPGKVIHENRLFQLIHYQPTTETVFEIPLLIIPPWINKYYILDLTPEKSFIRWAVDQGLSVYVLSWRQGGPETADAGLDTYVTEGEIAAIDLVLKASGAPAAHVIGYCVAGTVLAIALALMAARGAADKVRTATFFTAQVDFTQAGELLNFVTDAMIDTVGQLSAETGYLDGRWLATSFNLLRPTDLMWNYVVNNYLKGKSYAPFDLLYWNSDPTNVPGRFMQDYLCGLYRDNRLARPGGLSIDGTPIDLRLVGTPAYIQAGKDDHIAPAVSCFKLTTAFSGPHRFMLAGSGHIAGVVNPPAARKYQYWTLPEGVETPASLDEFRAAAIEHPGSWWPDWIAWLAPQSGGQVKARVPGRAKGFKALEDAPGRYVKERIA